MKAFVKTFTPALLAALALSVIAQRSPAADAPAAAAAQADAAKQTAETERRLAEAQRQLESAARQVAELSAQLNPRRGNQFFAFGEGPPPRAMIGVQLSSDEGQGGAKVVEVSPGGPAAEAGIKTGDIITSIGGQDLVKDSNPSRTMVEKMRDVDPNLKVQLGVLREGKKLNIDVTPRPAPQQVFRFERRGPGGPEGPGTAGRREFNLPMPPAGPTGLGERQQIILNRMEDGVMGPRFHGMEFATISERLGSYFGVKSGVLVVRAGNNPVLKLQDGDVIMAIDGREPTSAQHAGRILRSYQPGEKITLRVQRDRKVQTLEVKAPGAGED